MTYLTNDELTARALRTRIDRAEVDLLRGRLALEDFYARVALPTRGMFAGSIFIKRATADR